jgi:hypothetical protein
MNSTLKRLDAMISERYGHLLAEYDRKPPAPARRKKRITTARTLEKKREYMRVYRAEHAEMRAEYQRAYRERKKLVREEM